MRAIAQSANDRLHQLEKDQSDLAAIYAELEQLREMVQRKQAQIRTKHIHSGRSTLVARTRFKILLTEHRTAD